MLRLRFYQDTVWFFLLVVLVLGIGFYSAAQASTFSHPLKVAHHAPQEDGGLLR